MKKVLCIVDSYNWALANRANALKKYFKEAKFDILYFRDLQKINFENYNIVYSLNWPIHGYIKDKISVNRRYRLVTSVSSHIGQPSDKAFQRLLSQYDAVSLSNKFLYNEFRDKFRSLNLFYTPFGVDDKMFYPLTKPSEYNMIFGWVGNNSRSVKRFDIVEDTFKQFKDKRIQLKVVSQSSGLSRREMAKFYNSIGTLICFSSSEGTPNPILEAAACGRSIISTNVGNIPELVRGSKTIQIVGTKSDLKKAIVRNINNPRSLDDDGLFLKKQVDKYWKWDLRSEAFRKFLEI